MKSIFRSVLMCAVLFAGSAALAQNEYGEQPPAVQTPRPEGEHAEATAEGAHGEGKTPCPEGENAEAKGEHEQHGGGNVGAEVAEHILHHVADGDEFEFQIPFFDFPTIHLGEIFKPLLIERTPCACAIPVPTTLAAFPSLGQWLNGCWDLRPTKALLMIWLAMAILGFGLFFGSKRDQNGVPRGMLTNTIESLVLFVRDEIAITNIGKEEGPKYTPYLATLFFFIMCTNYLGLIPGMFSGTGVLAVTIGLAVITFFMTQIAGIRSAGPVGYFTHLFGDVPVWMKPVMFIVEVLGLFTKPFALLVRLFANMVAGHLVLFFLLGVIFIVHVGAAVISVPLAVGIYLLELFVAILQAYLFTLLTALFIGQSVALGHHGHAAHDEHAH